MCRIRQRAGSLERLVAERGGAVEWEVRVEGEGSVRAVSFPDLTGPLAAGERVLLNATATALDLGTGGADFVVARLAEPFPDEPFAGREAGHLIRLRYTPLQHRVRAVEEEASPHRAAIEAFESLDGIPVVCAELHSQMAAAALAARAVDPSLRLVFVMLDSAALPAAYSRLAAALRDEGVLAATITTGQAFGGDYEAVNVYTALIAARAVAGADVVLVAQGPGNVGTGTEYGWSGLSLVEALHATEALGGRPLLCARLSGGDPRARHAGWSHHTITLARLVRCPVELPLSASWAAARSPLPPALAAAIEQRRHRLETVETTPAWDALRRFRPEVTTMGRRPAEDPLFFEAALAAGIRAAALAARRT